MILVRAAAFNLLFYAWIAVLGIACLPLLALPRRHATVAARLWARGVLMLLRHVVGLDHQVEGRAHLPPGPALIAAKHESAWDTIVFLVALDDPAYVLKRELLALPIYGWFCAKLAMVPVDRTGGATALKAMVAAAGRAVAEGRSVVIFPQGTRTAPGVKAPYHPGVYALAAAFPALPVVPVAVDSGRFWGRRAFVKRPGMITLRYLEPLSPSLPRRAFMAELEARIEGATSALEQAKP